MDTRLEIAPGPARRNLRGPRGSTRAPLLEIFASIQGEGLHAGRPQVLVRLAGCPLRCRWCDTPGSWTLRATVDGVPEPRAGRIAFGGGSRWVAPLEVAAWVAALDPGARRAVSLTGGEPLVWPDFVLELRALVAPRPLHLETAAAHPEALERVVDRVDHLSVDLKLPLDLDPPVELARPGSGDSADDGGDGERAAPWSEPVPVDARGWAAVRERVLARLGGRDAALKLIVAGGRPLAAFLPLLDDVERLASDLPLFLQPVTPAGGERAPTRAELEAVLEAALDRELDARVVPQIHRVLGVP